MVHATFWATMASIWLGTVVTGSGPHAGDAKSPRTGFDIETVARIHALSAWLVVILVVGCLVVFQRSRRVRAARASRLLLITVLLQGVIGYLQYFLGIPVGIVVLHMVGLTLLTAAARAAAGLDDEAMPMTTNPVLTTELPFALPDFAAASTADYRDAARLAMAEQLAGVADVRESTEPATVENVLGALEDAGAPLQRALNAFWAVYSSDATDELEELYQALAPRLAEHEDSIYLDQGLYHRLGQLRDRIDSGETEADAEDRYLLDETLRAFRRAGVELDMANQDRLRALNKRLAELSSRFESLNKGARNAGGIDVTREQLAGLSDEEIESLRTDGGFRIELVNTTQQPLAAKLTDPVVRRQLLENSTRRALGGEFDTRCRRRRDRPPPRGASEPAGVRQPRSDRGRAGVR